ncbi:hypothetical protein M0802_012319 [Mischocyttarus mexicanus]|nr:hypothetical protein M0802_012319 [Mischocyttarus mexicanus]
MLDSFPLGPSTINVPYVPPTHTVSISIQNKSYIPESYSNYDNEIHNDTPSKANYVSQLHEPIIINNSLNIQNILPRDVQNNTLDMHSQLNLPVETYFSFQQNYTTHCAFQKDFFDNDFGHALTQRLISPSIPVVQIRRLRHIHSQFGVYVQVINVLIEVNTMVRSLPSKIDDHSITVHIKRRKIPKSSYVFGIINKRKIKALLRYLTDTPLYTSYSIRVVDSFLNDQDAVKDEIVYDEDGDNDISERMPIDKSLIAQQQTLIWNDEMYLRNAPGEGNVPISLLIDEHAEELFFPQIYLGQFRTLCDGLTVTPFMMATSELRRSDKRGVSPQHFFYLTMKIMRIRIRDLLSIAFKHIRKGITITKKQIVSENYIQGCIESNLAFLRTILNSAYYWSARKKNLFAMISRFSAK